MDILDKLDELRVKSSAGEWAVHDQARRDHTICVVNKDGTCCPIFERCGSHSTDDADYIVSLVNAYPLIRDRLIAAEKKEPTK